MIQVQIQVRSFGIHNPSVFMGGVGFEKSIFDKRYTTDAVHVWHSNWTYVDGALTLSQ